MRWVHEMKVGVLTRGGLISELVVTTNDEKSAESIVGRKYIPKA